MASLFRKEKFETFGSVKTLTKSLPLFLLIYFLHNPVFGQAKLGLGLSVIPQWNHMTYMKSYMDQYDANDNSYFTIGGGLHADLQATKWFAIESGLFYNPKGMVVTREPRINLQLNYLNVPVKLRFSIPVGKKVTIDYLAGLYYLRLLKVKFMGQPVSGLGYFEKSSYSFMVGNGVTCRIADGVHFFTNISFDMSLKDVEKIKVDVQGYALGESQHVAVALNLGIKFNIPLSAPPVVVKPGKKGAKTTDENQKQATPRYRKS